ncbi:alkanesulfonate monooxygenase SsuD/methylene tetrahydromethanopterin reductase-like flavin-dependent oxidoreductase (luciferase family) [Nocardia tenerifensis]|uniref:Alkanesulfonate monooxygenase SsuD/methylene tetrahydromethanopterin reductase-like flavin-dependent oxidoreductase (Luciferase family) n=1 Tax=Nocardia tenerifensis TaxID=228006 RepID=A0A318JYA5_9NOCA|nr:LLM class flavin-dependent oxidoreductase [Nocardia tenerifensis]PXX62295.1 alkanesulfonate monooxygenase SsuD/methylene tetrahydromethanopterin reductase-like flavin-dependent oxidoreductase (luciferase family) [Nocardia tenerifensis]
MADSDFFLAVELAGTGIHPASWRREDSRAEDLFTGGYWVDAITAAEKAGVDAVFVPDSFGLQPGGPGVARGRLDAVAIAARVTAATRRIGLLPQGAVTHTEPFHLAKAVQSLDFATLGRAGWEVTVSEGVEQARAFGRKGEQDARSLWHEADEAIEVVTRLWDSWEDDAEIRDVPTGRFIDRDKLHYIDFAGDNFSVKGPSITPRSPQGQSIVAVRASDEASTEVAVRRGDLIRFAAGDLDAARDRRTALRTAVCAAGREPDAVRVLLEVEVHLADSPVAARDEVAQLDRWAALTDTRDSLRHIGTPDTLRELLEAVEASGAADGVVLRPLAVPATVGRLAALDREPVSADTLRGRLGLPRPASRYAASTPNQEGTPS